MTEHTNHADHANVKIHPPILTLIYLVIAFLLTWILPLPFVVPAFLKLLGFVLVVIGVLFGSAAFYAFSQARTTLNPHGSVSVIVTTGIYRFTRNPIYLAFLLMLIGFPLNSGSYWGVVLAPFMVWSMNRLVIEKEEAYLEEKFRDVYTSYKLRVRRWL